MTRERNILIVDDDQNMCVDLKEALQDITDNKVLYTESSEKAMDLIETEGSPEMVFMDICLDKDSGRGDGENGIALAKKIQSQAPAAEIIFISGYDDYYLDVYEVEHAWFLRKPISKSMLEKAIARARERSGAGDRVFAFTQNRTEYLIPYREILYFEKKRRKVLLYREGVEAPYEFYSTMDELWSMLPDYFFRCHNSYVINLRNVQQYSRTYFDVAGHHVPISRVYERRAREAFYGLLEQDR